MSARKPRHRVIENYRKGTAFYDVTRQSWETGEEVTLRTFLMASDAYRWVEDIERRQDFMVTAVDRSA